MYTLNIIKAIKKTNANKIRDFIYENYCKRIVFSIEVSYGSLNARKNKNYCCLLTY